jgi:acylphosphatase
LAGNSSPKNDIARVHVWVTGRVQGVGFRAFVAYSAGRLGVRGWVRNVGYDTLEAVAEGTQAQIEHFIQAVKTGPRGAHVDESRVETDTPDGEFTNFEVRASR